MARGSKLQQRSLLYTACRGHHKLSQHAYREWYPILQFIGSPGASSACYVHYPMRGAVGLAKQSKMHLLLLYACVLAGRKDIANQNAGGKIVLIVYIGCCSNPKAGISHLWCGTQGFFPCKNAKFRGSFYVKHLRTEVL